LYVQVTESPEAIDGGVLGKNAQLRSRIPVEDALPGVGQRTARAVRSPASTRKRPRMVAAAYRAESRMAASERART
jgi:hypothetical protein